MMSAQAGFAMVMKLCKGGCVKMSARGEGYIENKKSIACCLPMCMAPYHIFTSKWAGVVRMSKEPFPRVSDYDFFHMLKRGSRIEMSC